jgi:putative acyl-CoA dehydrogenase
MCDLFLTLAQTERGLSCFALPRWLPDGTRNKFHLQRLKDKLGNRSNASSEVELDGAWARLVGEEGRGVATIIEMVGHTRLDCCIGAAAGMRQGVAQAIHHARHRSAFGKLLIDQPLMQNVLADLALESEAATVTMARLARAYDEGQTHPDARRLARLATAVCKYWLCKRASAHAAESLECFGGNGYVEESGMPRLYREAPLNGIWEGSGNVICLDVLRAMAKDPESVQLFFDEVLLAGDKRIADMVESVKRELMERDAIEQRARIIVEQMAKAWQASLLYRHSPRMVADAYLLARLEPRGHAFGTLPHGVDLRGIIERNMA